MRMSVDVQQPTDNALKRQDPTLRALALDLDWRITFGTAFTAIYLLSMSAYVSNTIGWTDFQHLPVEKLGNFLEGAFAPLAFLWLVIGYFLQKKELMLNTQAMKMQFVEIQKSAEQAVLQSRAIAATEMHQRKESFLRISQVVEQQLCAIMGLLYYSSQGAEGNEERVPQEKMAEMWSAMGAENREIFSREMLGLLLTSGDSYKFKLLWGTPIRNRHTESFEFNFARLHKAAEDCDEEGMIADALMGGANGHLYRRIQSLREDIPEGYTIGVYDFDPDTRE
jgi:hypothetical protein